MLLYKKLLLLLLYGGCWYADAGFVTIDADDVDMVGIVDTPITGKRFFGVVVLLGSNVALDIVVCEAVASDCCCLIDSSGNNFDVVVLAAAPYVPVLVLMDGVTGKRFLLNVCTGVVCVGVLPLLST